MSYIVIGVFVFGITEVKAQSAIDMMTTLFQGNYSKSQIKSRMDLVMTRYGLDLTEENYNRAGSALISMQNGYGVAEMDILNCMKNINKAGMTFPTAAAVCTQKLE